MASRIRSFFLTARNRRSQSGAAMIETLIFVPTIFILTFMTLEVANIMRVYEKTSWMAEYAVREASEGTYDDGQRATPQVLRDRFYLKFRDLIGKRNLNCDDPNEEDGGCRDVFCIQYSTYPREELGFDDSVFSCGSDDDLTDLELSEFKPGHFVSVTVNAHYKPMLGVFHQLFPGAEELPISSTFDRIISASASIP